MFSSVSIALFVLIGAISCTDVYITNPYDVITWKIGKQETVTWNILPGGPVIDAFNVELMDGDESSANVVCNIASWLPITATSATWVVPSTIAPSRNYFIRVSSPNLSLQRFSHRFAIEGVQCTTKTSSNSSSSSITGSIAATSKASQSSVNTGTASKGTSTSSAESETTVTRSLQTNEGVLNYQAATSNSIAVSIAIVALIAMML